MKAIVTGVGWVNAAGTGHGRQNLYSAGGEGIIPKLSRKDIFRGPFPRFGRMDKYSRLGLASIALALKDAGLDEWTDTRQIAIIASTVYGCLNTDGDYYDTVIPEGGRLASPNLFVYALPNTYFGEAAIHFGLTGPSFALFEPSLTGLQGLSIAIDGVAMGEYEAAIAGICDAGPPPSLAVTGGASQGALFFVLRGEHHTELHSYGLLTTNRSGAIFFDGEKVEDLSNLARMCTARIHIKKEDNRDK